MGSVSLSAGSYLVQQLDLQPAMTVPVDHHFDVPGVRISEGLVEPGRYPSNRFYVWRNPGQGRDLVLFVGESQPVTRGYELCQSLLRIADTFGVERVVTFSSLVTPSAPGPSSRVVGVASGPSLLDELRRMAPEVPILQEGEISGLNGTMLAAAAARGLPALGLLAEVPQMAVSVPYLRATHALLTVFTGLSGLELDLTSLAREADRVNQGLEELVGRLKAIGMRPPEVEDAKQPEVAEESEVAGGDEDAPTQGVDPSVLAEIEAMFLASRADRSEALRLKALLDQHALFAAYEDRFLDLFRKSA
jgi:uncharacterized protein